MNEMTTSSTYDTSKWTVGRAKLEGLSLMDHLFNKLAGAYPATWKAAFSNDFALENWRDTWAEAFEEEGITPQDIASGLRNIRKLYVDWTPNLHQFLHACLPPIDPEGALYEAIREIPKRAMAEDKWSHPAIYWAAVQIGEFDLTSKTVKDLQPRFTRALKDVLSKPEAIEPVPAPAPRLAAPTQTMDKKAADATLATLLGGLKKRFVDAEPKGASGDAGEPA
jgi:Replication protein P